MIIEYYGGYMDLGSISDLIHIRKEGTSAFHIIEGAKKIGFEAKGYECNLEDLIKDEVALPIIASVTLNQSFSHFIVIYEINKKKKELVIADPSNKIINMKFDIFNSIFSNSIITFYPIKNIPKFEKYEMSFKEILPFLNSSKSLIGFVTLISLFIILYSVITSFYGETMFRYLNIKDNNIFLIIFITFVIITIIKIINEYIRSSLMFLIDKKIDLLLTMDTVKKILWLPYRYYHNHPSGDIMTRLNELDEVRDSICKWIMIIIVDIPLIITSFIIMLIISKDISLIILICSLLEIIILKIFHANLKDKIENATEDITSLSTMEIESLRGFETIKGISKEDYFYESIIKRKVKSLKSINDLERVVNLENLSKNMVEEISNLIILYVGCVLVLDDKLSFGNLLTIQSILTYFFSPLKDFVEVSTITKKAKHALKRISSFKVEEEIGYLNMSDIDIEIKDLNFSYLPEKELLKNINLHISKGEKIIILGPSGSGKSTLFKLLKRYYQVDRGYITIGNSDINDYKDMHKIKYINQNETLFTGSMLENLLLGRNISEEELDNIIKLCELKPIINKSNLGLYNFIEENGINLSGGERQRIVLARTCIDNFDILIIDEGLNQLDVELERRILTRLFSMYEDKTIIVISHRNSNMDLFRRIFNMKEGCLYEI